MVEWINEEWVPEDQIIYLGDIPYYRANADGFSICSECGDRLSTFWIGRGKNKILCDECFIKIREEKRNENKRL